MARQITSSATSDSALGAEAVHSALSEPETFDGWQRAFAVTRLRILGMLGTVVVASYAVADGLLLGWGSPGVVNRIPSVLALVVVVVLAQWRRAWALRHVDAALILSGCIVAFSSVASVPIPEGDDLTRALLAFTQGRFGITLVLLGLAVMVPARLRVHLVVQIATCVFFGVRLFDVHGVAHEAGELVSRAMGLLWVSFFADVSVVMFTRLQRSEFEARDQLARESAQRKVYLDGLVRIGTSATATDPDHQARAVLDELVGLLGAERSLLYLRDEQGTLAFRAGRDASGNDVASDDARPGANALRVPLRMRDHLVGEIVLERPPDAGELSAADQDFLHTLASHAAVALETLRTAAQLRTARDAAVDAASAKDAFLQTMGHELRTPVTTMLGYTEMLVEDLEDAGDEEHATDARQAHEAAANLLTIVSDVLELTQLETERRALKPSSFPVADLLAELEAEVGPLAERTDNHLDVAVDPSAGSLVSDRERVATILRKLLENACKFTKGGTVTCHASRCSTDGVESVRFRVGDTGIGMTEAELTRCFEPFYQADPSATRAYGGAGLGLTTAARLAETLDGEITASARPGEGAEFVLTLPAAVGRSPSPR